MVSLTRKKIKGKNHKTETIDGVNIFQNTETVSESESTTIQKLQNFRGLIHDKSKSKPVDNQRYFSVSESTTATSIESKRRIKKKT